MPDKKTAPWPILPARLALAILVIVACVGGYGALRVSFVEEVTALLPSKDEDRSSYLALARQWGFMQKVAVVVGPDSPSSDRLHQDVDSLASAIAGIKGVHKVTSAVDAAAVRRAALLVAQSAPRLARDVAAVSDDLEIATRLGALKDKLAAPEAMVMQEFLLADPLGFGSDALRELESAGEAMGATVDRGHIVSREKTHALIVVDIDFDPFVVSEAKRFVQALDRVVTDTLGDSDGKQLGVTVLGGVHYTASSAEVVSRDIVQAFVLTAVCVVLIFFVFFRSLRMLLVALLPGGAGIGVAIGVMALLGEPLHALTLGFAATITGISVDYVIHLLHRARGEEGADARMRMGQAARRVARPVVLGCATTVGAFGLVALSNFVALRQLALFAVVSVPVAMLVTLWVLPAFHRFLLPGRNAGGVATQRFRQLLQRLYEATGNRRWRIAMITLFICVTAVALQTGSGVTMSGDPRDLGYRDRELEKRSRTLQSLFPGFADQALVIASGGSYEQALQANDAVYGALLANGFRRTEVVSISPFLPSLKSQRRALVAVQQAMGGEREQRTKELFAQAGFKPSYVARVMDLTQVAPILPTTYATASLGQMVDDALKVEGEEFFVLTRVHAGDDKTVARIVDLVTPIAGSRVVSERLETQQVLSVLGQEIIWMLGVWIGAAVVFLTLSTRSLWFGLRSTLPALFGVSLVIFLFALLERPLTPVASAGMTLVMGLGIDYGIFMQSQPTGVLSRTAAAVIASALTTVAGFGVLALSRVQGMADLGLIILVGVLGALIAALCLVPALLPQRAVEKRPPWV